METTAICFDPADQHVLTFALHGDRHDDSSCGRGPKVYPTHDAALTAALDTVNTYRGHLAQVRIFADEDPDERSCFHWEVPSPAQPTAKPRRFSRAWLRSLFRTSSPN